MSRIITICTGAVFFTCVPVAAQAENADAFTATQNSITELRDKANNKDIKAETLLGTLYSTGEAQPLLPKDKAEAAKWFRKAAEQGDPDAQVKLGGLYRHGSGVQKDEAEAVKWYRKAADQGNARGELMLGTAYYVGYTGVTQNYSEAERWTRKAADQGDDYAEAALGTMYLRGQGVTQDNSGAMTWWLKAAQKGNPIALTYLGTAYHDGTIVQKSDTDALNYWRKSAERGDVAGQFYLALAYTYGWGIPTDYVTSYMWLTIAARDDASDKQRKAEINKALSLDESAMTREQVDRATRLAGQWKQQKGLIEHQP